MPVRSSRSRTPRVHDALADKIHTWRVCVRIAERERERERAQLVVHLYDVAQRRVTFRRSRSCAPDRSLRIPCKMCGARVRATVLATGNHRRCGKPAQGAILLVESARESITKEACRARTGLSALCPSRMGPLYVGTIRRERERELRSSNPAGPCFSRRSVGDASITDAAIGTALNRCSRRVLAFLRVDYARHSTRQTAETEKRVAYAQHC